MDNVTSRLLYHINFLVEDKTKTVLPNQLQAIARSCQRFYIPISEIRFCGNNLGVAVGTPLATSTVK